MAESAVNDVLKNLNPGLNSGATDAPACKNCRYFSHFGGNSVCRRSPPSPSFPPVAATDWCGEFSLRQDLAVARHAKLVEKLDAIRADREEEMRLKPFNGYSAGAGDYYISGCRLIKTSNACPEQYDVFDDKTGVQIGYLRLRHGKFRADLRSAGGPTVYEADTIGDGSFEESERLPQLKNAVAAIKKELIASTKAAKKDWAKNWAAGVRGMIYG